MWTIIAIPNVAPGAKRSRRNPPSMASKNVNGLFGSVPGWGAGIHCAGGLAPLRSRRVPLAQSTSVPHTEVLRGGHTHLPGSPCSLCRLVIGTILP